MVLTSFNDAAYTATIREERHAHGRARNLRRPNEGASRSLQRGFTWSVIEMDDLPPGVRACYRASRELDHEHKNNCPDCLDNEVECLLMDAASHREDGNAEVAESLEIEAEELRQRIAVMRARM